MRVALVPCGMGQEAPLPPPPLTTAGSARSKASLSGSTWRTRWSLPRTLASGERPPKVRRPPLVLRRLPSRHPVPKRSRPRLLRPRLRTQGLSCPTPQKKCASREANPWQLELPPASDSVVLYYRKKVKYRGGEHGRDSYVLPLVVGVWTSRRSRVQASHAKQQQQQQQQQYITDNRQLPVLLTSQYVDGQKPSSPPRLNPDFARRGRSCQSAWEANRK